MFASASQDIQGELDQIRADGLYKDERVIVTPQGSSIRVAGGAEHFTRVTFQLEQHGPVVKLTLTHDELDEKDVKFFTGISGGWPAVMSNLKSLLEGGEPLVAKPC